MPSRAAMRRGRRDHFTKDIGNRSFEDEADVITVALASRSKNALVESPNARREGSAASPVANMGYTSLLIDQPRGPNGLHSSLPSCDPCCGWGRLSAHDAC